MTLQKINTDHQEDVTFPSDDNGSVRPSERKEEIVLPSELFERKGMRYGVIFVWEQNSMCIDYIVL